MIFTTTKQIRFHHCDPAGIVFYPRYYGLLHEAQEDWLGHMGFPEHGIINAGFGVPIVGMQTDFVGMSRFGDVVHIDVDLWKLGNSSIGMRYFLYSKEVNKNDDTHAKTPNIDAKQPRLKAKSTVVYTQVAQSKAVRIPDDLRAAMLPFLNAE